MKSGFFEKFFTLTGFILLFIMACSNKLHILPNVSVPKVVPVAFKSDSIKHNLTKIDTDFRRTYQSLSEKAVNHAVPYDTLLSLNAQWQLHYLLLADRATERRHSNDSLNILLHQVRNDISAARKEDRIRYNQSQQLKQSEKIVTTTYSMFDVIIVFCLIICTIASLLSIYKYIHVFIVKTVSKMHV